MNAPDTPPPETARPDTVPPATLPLSRPVSRLVPFDGSQGVWFRRLARLLEPYHGLRYAEFVDYFYVDSPTCRLNLLVNDADEVLGVLGHEVVPFEVPGRSIKLGFGSNFRAFQSGAGGILFLNWLKQCHYGLIFGGSPDTHRLLDPRRWTTYPGVGQFELNSPFAENPSDVWWKAFAKTLLNWSPTRRRVDRLPEIIPSSAESIGTARVTVVEERDFSNDMLPRESPFSFRFTPDATYLNWRYNTRLEFVRYRAFRILRDGVSAGYVVLNEQRQRVLVAQADADDVLTLARGIIAAVVSSSTGARRRQGVIITAAHAALRAVLTQLGFQERLNARPFVVGSLLRKPDWSEDSSDWLVNFDWCDNGLRPPFLGQAPLREVA